MRLTIRQLADAQKDAKGVPAYSRFINRRLGRLLAAVAFRLGLSPDMVTAISAVWTFSGIALLALVEPSWELGLGVSACLVLGYAFDAADGQLARLRGGGSPAGEWLDHIVDCAKISSLHLAVAVGMYRFEYVERGAALLVPLGFAVAAAAHFFGAVLNDLLRRQHLPSARRAPAAPPSVLRSLIVVPTDYGLLCLVFLMLGEPVLFFYAYTFLFVVTTVYLALASRKWFADLKKLSTTTAAQAAPDGSSSAP
ncbi:MAG: CDP-alcohol phosphatidyltransferase family protein [Actinomycetota bacterium]|nr:CDP-alcohol phosphatidyltransferase family protein [Actinomycetota bacterium]